MGVRSERGRPMRAHPVGVGLAALAGTFLALAVVGLAAGVIAALVQGEADGLEALLPMVIGVIIGGLATWPAAVAASWLAVRGTTRDRRTVARVAVFHPVAVVLSYLLARAIGHEDAVFGFGLGAAFLAAAGARAAALRGASDPNGR